MRRLRYGRRVHGLGGSLHEIAVGNRLIVTLARCYDHVDDLTYGGMLVLATGRWAVGLRVRRDYLIAYLGVGTVTVALAEPDEFDVLHRIEVE